MKKQHIYAANQSKKITLQEFLLDDIYDAVGEEFGTEDEEIIDYAGYLAFSAVEKRPNAAFGYLMGLEHYPQATKPFTEV